MRKLFYRLMLFYLVLLVFSLFSCNRFSSKEHFPMVFSVNLSSAKTEIKLIEGEESLYTDVLEPFSVHSLVFVKASRNCVLSSTGELEGKPSLWRDPSGEPYNIRLEDGKIYGILIDALLHVSLSVLLQVYGSDPQISILNGTSEPLAQVQVAPDFNKNVKVYVQSISPNQPTEFFSLKPKAVSFFWQTQKQVLTSEYFYLRKENVPLVKQMEVGKFYFFLASNDFPGETTNGQLWDITPSNGQLWDITPPKL